eukprot:366053-Chlamydomonas_euryale.AAC.5
MPVVKNGMKKLAWTGPVQLGRALGDLQTTSNSRAVAVNRLRGRILRLGAPMYLRWWQVDMLPVQLKVGGCRLSRRRAPDQMSRCHLKRRQARTPGTSHGRGVVQSLLMVSPMSEGELQGTWKVRSALEAMRMSAIHGIA